MKRIVIFTGYYLPKVGGVERYTQKLVDKLIEQGISVSIVTTNHDNLPYEEGKTVKIYRLPVYKIFKYRYPIIKKNKKNRDIVNKLKKQNFDYVICNTRFHLTTLYGLKFARSINRPALVIEHGSNHFTIGNSILDYFGAMYEHALTNKVKKYKANFFGVSERCNQWLKHFGIEAKGVFYNSIDSDDYEKYKKQKFNLDVKNKIVITYAGRLIKEKGILMLLSVFKQLETKYKNIILVIAGDGPLKDEIKKYTTDSNIVFVGKLSYSEVMSLYNITDIFVHPSMFPEGLPTAILEAGLMKCAIVATDRGGTIEVINDDKYGLISKENEKDLQINIEKYLNDMKYMKKSKENIHNRIIENFSWIVTSKKIKKVMEEDIYEKKY